MKIQKKNLGGGGSGGGALVGGSGSGWGVRVDVNEELKFQNSKCQKRVLFPKY